MEGKGGTGGLRVGAGREAEEDRRGGGGSHDGAESCGQEKPQVAKSLIIGEIVSIALHLPSPGT